MASGELTVFVESNFVLELTFAQEESDACSRILGLAKQGGVHLVVPAYCLVEPYETLARRLKERRQLKSSIDHHVRDFLRTAGHAEKYPWAPEMSSLLISAIENANRRHEEIQASLLEHEIAPLTLAVLAAAATARAS